MSTMEENNKKLSKISLETDQGILMSEQMKWGLPLKEVYKHAVTFFKDKDGKAVHLSYEDRLKLVAYTQQAAHGPFDQNAVPPIGVLDVIGRDRHAAWQALGSISQAQALSGFVHTLDRLCPLFSPYIEAITKDSESKNEQISRKEEEVKAHAELEESIQIEVEKQQSDILTEEQQIQKVKDALNQQTYKQFEQYAQQQYPENFEQQAVLIRQLQDQHYQQYMQQLALNQRLANSPIADHALDNKQDSDVNDTPTKNKNSEDVNSSSEFHSPLEPTETATSANVARDSEHDEFWPAIEPAQMWTRNKLESFKRGARLGGGQLTIGHGETVTIRVPTHEEAYSISFEFATDHYDLGFGLFFEWGKSPSSEVTLHFSDSDDEDSPDDDDDGDAADDEECTATNDAELGKGGSEQGSASTRRSPVSVLMPIYRRDCHKQVYTGRHKYAGDGVYLLKFDNTYSLWRSKVLYYKIYYTA